MFFLYFIPNQDVDDGDDEVKPTTEVKLFLGYKK